MLEGFWPLPIRAHPNRGRKGLRAMPRAPGELGSAPMLIAAHTRFCFSGAVPPQISEALEAKASPVDGRIRVCDQSDRLPGVSVRGRRASGSTLTRLAVQPLRDRRQSSFSGAHKARFGTSLPAPSPHGQSEPGDARRRQSRPRRCLSHDPCGDLDSISLSYPS